MSISGYQALFLDRSNYKTPTSKGSITYQHSKPEQFCFPHRMPGNILNIEMTLIYISQYFVYLFFCVNGVRIAILILEKLSQVSVKFNWNVLFFRPTFNSGNSLKQ